MKFVDLRILTKLLSVFKYVSYNSSSWTDSSCHENTTEYQPIEVFFTVELFVTESVRRTDIENELNNFLTQSLPSDQFFYSIVLSNNVNLQLCNFSQFSCKSNDGLTLIPTGMKFSPQRYRKSFVSNVLLCRLITLGNEEYNITESNQVYLIRKEVTVEPSQYEVSPDGGLLICYEYLKAINFFEKELYLYPNFEFERYLWIVSLSCTVVSVIFLSISLFIYSLFPGLRTIPGKLMMVLMTSLLLVLIFQQVSSVVVEMDVGCTVIGVFLHYFWLVVFTSMHASNFRMFKDFTSSKTRMHSPSVCCDKTTMLNTLYILLLPFIIVVSHIAISAILSEGMIFGYGGRKCFIMERTSIFVTFISPVVLICISNIYFFVCTVLSIHNTPIPQGQENQRNELGVYMRLSSITGFSWLLQVIDSFLPLSAFSFVASSINSLQGIFIFIAFVLNKRNMNMLKSKFGSKGKNPQTRPESFGNRSSGHTVSTKL